MDNQITMRQLILFCVPHISHEKWFLLKVSTYKKKGHAISSFSHKWMRIRLVDTWIQIWFEFKWATTTSYPLTRFQHLLRCFIKWEREGAWAIKERRDKGRGEVLEKFWSVQNLPRGEKKEREVGAGFLVCTLGFLPRVWEVRLVCHEYRESTKF